MTIAAIEKKAKKVDFTYGVNVDGELRITENAYVTVPDETDQDGISRKVEEYILGRCNALVSEKKLVLEEGQKMSIDIDVTSIQGFVIESKVSFR